MLNCNGLHGASLEALGEGLQAPQLFEPLAVLQRWMGTCRAYLPLSSPRDGVAAVRLRTTSFVQVRPQYRGRRLVDTRKSDTDCSYCAKTPLQKASGSSELLAILDLNEALGTPVGGRGTCCSKFKSPQMARGPQPSLTIRSVKDSRRKAVLWEQVGKP